MTSLEQLFGTNGFRGIVGRELTPEVAIKFGLAVGTYFKDKSIAVAMDGRMSSEMLTKALISGLQRSGVNVYFLGMLPTPVLQKYVKEHGELAGGVMVTASHNPPEYNGFKVVGSDGVELLNEEEEKIEKIFLSSSFFYAKWHEVKPVITLNDAIPNYIRHCLKHIDVDLIRRRKMRIVVDFGHGVSALSVPNLLNEVNCEVISVNSNIDGTFPVRPPEPTPENLGFLKKAVLDLDADLGVAYDGDGDRSIFCDEKGNIWWGDVSGTIIGKYLAEKHRIDKIATGINSSSLVEHVLSSLGIKVIRTKVGSRNLSKAMINNSIIWGFEENGGGIYAPHQYVRDGGMTTLLMIQTLVFYGLSLSEMCKDLPRFFQVKTKVKIREGELRKIIIKELRSYYGMRASRVETVDGVKAWFNDTDWVLIRPSGTEPIVRIFSEAKSKLNAEKMATEAKKIIEAILKDLKTDLH